ncbi:hypothetical protein [Flavobacterium ajazii]|uniref:hypothetical protein n=1 Tax=Flavobacterium ajazii TaxID=2692318 RepID=UPI0013D375E6|nr:hypothetical protein [Flavobacterium ajazii]
MEVNITSIMTQKCQELIILKTSVIRSIEFIIHAIIPIVVVNVFAGKIKFIKPNKTVLADRAKSKIRNNKSLTPMINKTIFDQVAKLLNQLKPSKIMLSRSHITKTYVKALKSMLANT